MKKKWIQPQLQKIDFIQRITKGGSGLKTEKLGQWNKNRRPA